MKKLENAVCIQNDTFTKQDLEFLFAMRSGRGIQAIELMRRTHMNDVNKFGVEMTKLHHMGYILYDQGTYFGTSYRLTQEGQECLSWNFKQLLNAYDKELLW
jgi:hypothetical protein